MIDFTKMFESQQVLLRPVRRDDYNEFIPLTQDKGLWTYFTNDLSEKDALLAWVEAGIKELTLKKRLALSIVDKKTNSVAGSTSIGNISERDKRVEIGWTWLGRKYQGKGINDQAKYLLLKYCFEELECERVEFKTDVLNEPARNALKRIGAVEEGVLRSHTLMTHNRRRDTIYYSILKGEWKNINAKTTGLKSWL
ncbi:N-acetyltransferase [Mariniphaga sediminis]|uniref:N-acetyltransferase n=1 Tax=Mariniphaga sediminis TaxID=1628158 RepID=A0A399D0C7_9BACT|nr:GNAT family protein [Mariniphaga sediminis]RIH65047.1 N-acetyltransferase [Mariniphaga sediminis]